MMTSEKVERFFYFINDETRILTRKELLRYLFDQKLFRKIVYVKRVFFADKKKDNKATVYVVNNYKDVIQMLQIEDTLSFKI